MVQRPRGTRDLLPDEMERRRALESLLRGVARRWGYREVQTPAFEELELFTARSGPEIVRSLYAFKDKDGREMCLRPELTAPAIRLYLAEMSRAPKPLRLCYFGPCYRYEEPQKNRYREFWQFGVEVIGAGGSKGGAGGGGAPPPPPPPPRPPPPPTPLREAEAEIIGLAWTMAREAGVPNAEVRLGHIGFVRHCLHAARLPPESQGQVLRALDKGDFEYLKAHEYDWAMEFLAGRGFRELAEHLATFGTVKFGKIAMPKQQLAEVEQLKSALEPYEVPVKETPSIVRGLDYYTGPVFEVHVPGLGAQSQICGGGSYRLDVGGREVESTGFAFGFDRLLAASALQAPGEVRVAVCSTPGARGEALRVARALRSRAAAETDLLGRSLAKQLEHAGATGATHAAIVGEREARAGALTLKDLKTGKQRTVTVEEALRLLGEVG